MDGSRSRRRALEEAKVHRVERNGNSERQGKRQRASQEGEETTPLNALLDDGLYKRLAALVENEGKTATSTRGQAPSHRLGTNNS